MKFYKCRHCGNVVVMLNDSGVNPVCCGEKMEELVANTVDAAFEKHLPVVKVEGNNMHVEVGSVLHPMTEAHLIEFIAVETEHGFQVRKLTKDDQPMADFSLTEKPVAVYEYCNLHGLWKKEL